MYLVYIMKLELLKLELFNLCALVFIKLNAQVSTTFRFFWGFRPTPQILFAIPEKSNEWTTDRQTESIVEELRS